MSNSNEKKNQPLKPVTTPESPPTKQPKRACVRTKAGEVACGVVVPAPVAPKRNTDGGEK